MISVGGIAVGDISKYCWRTVFKESLVLLL